MTPQLRHHFIYDGKYHCPSCALPMHIDPYKFDSLIRVIMCASERCEHFGFAWTVDITTSIGVSDRKYDREAEGT
jgi:hypothetical protein